MLVLLFDGMFLSFLQLKMANSLEKLTLVLKNKNNYYIKGFFTKSLTKSPNSILILSNISYWGCKKIGTYICKDDFEM